MEILGLQELENAIKRNPQMVLSETKKFLQRGMAVYMRSINQNPWRIGGTGGGSPVATGTLKGSHQITYGQFEAVIKPNATGQASYYGYVHEGTKNMESRPWLDYAKQRGDSDIRKLEGELLTAIIKDLAR